jgi:PPOX class probable F420-dependent enzyme
VSLSRRAAIAMSAGEVAAFLDEQRTVICATLGRDGWPHLMPLWYVVRDGECWAWTYAKSQKVRNLERDPRCTLQVEAGERYDELRGVMLRCTCTLHRDVEVVAGVGEDLAERYGGARTAMLAQAPKRVAMQFAVRDTASWDHQKL